MHPTRRQLYAYLALAAVVVAVGVRYVVLPRSAGPPAGEQLVLAPAASPSASAQGGDAEAGGAAQADVVVYVCGAVRAPGVVRLPAGARVADALALAGGATGKAELAAVNLAAVVTDGQQILVPERGAAVAVAPAAGAAGAAGPSAGAGGTVAGPIVNLNTASQAELETLSGVGPATAQKIIEYRDANGGFKSIEDVKNVSGIGDAKFAAMKDSITV
jgi:competence protein ComEA